MHVSDTHVLVMCVSGMSVSVMHVSVILLSGMHVSGMHVSGMHVWGMHVVHTCTCRQNTQTQTNQQAFKSFVVELGCGSAGANLSSPPSSTETKCGGTESQQWAGGHGGRGGQRLS